MEATDIRFSQTKRPPGGDLFARFVYLCSMALKAVAGYWCCSRTPTKCKHPSGSGRAGQVSPRGALWAVQHTSL